MEFGLTEEQVLLQDSVGRYLADNAGLERARQFADGGEERATDVCAALAELGVSGLIIFALDRPNWNARLPPPCMLRKIQIQNAMKRSQGRAPIKIALHPPVSKSPEISTPAASSSDTRSSLTSPGRIVWKRANS